VSKPASNKHASKTRRPKSRRAPRLSVGPLDRIASATTNSLNGLRHGIRHEAAIRDEAFALLLAIPVGAFIAPGLLWYFALIGVLVGVVAIELLNTAVEKLADHVAPERHPSVGILKDYGSAAVMCALVVAGLVWLSALLLRLGWI
jgi:diacylglycerol kinase (ATP)